MSTVLNPHRIVEIFTDCFFRGDEDTTSHVRAEGVMATVGFHPERLEGHRAEIEAMLAELPDDFRVSVGEGSSFLRACVDRHGNQWTNLHKTVDELITLGIAIGKVAYLTPREMWVVMPGGMPYIVVKI